MKAIYKKELSSFFRSMTGYALIAFLITFTGVYFMIYNLNQGYPFFSYTLSAVMLVLLVLVPVLTMRSFAEERRSRTDQLLFTSPVKIRQVVAGKYLAMCTVYLIPNLIFCLFPLVIKSQGSAYFLSDYSSIFQFFLMGCAFISIGMFFSSLTESPIIAAVSTFAATLILYIWEYLTDYLPDGAVANLLIVLVICTILAALIFHVTKNRFLCAAFEFITAASAVTVCIVKSSLFEGLLKNVLGSLDLAKGFNNAAFNNVFDVSAVILQLTVIAVFEFLTVQSIEKRRWS
ncbi:ABC transporter permease [Anaerovorax odorimutans]|uniref:ABC transporter permease n=1 Tax=Anaerovorax odorimutans TaxID=109327 RepID=A0ABT1RQE9_9FIRM|nr:ABC transporter permease [Anaerovorax odorimutans]MCQ4637389.1 ABC transporter permease [Anaerovorax odorimutans]